MHNHENEFAANVTFGFENSFTVAAAITFYDGSNVDVMDPEVGELKFYLKNWDSTAENSSTKFDELKTRICTREDLNYGKGDSAES